jgi:hypothetical protein
MHSAGEQRKYQDHSSKVGKNPELESDGLSEFGWILGFRYGAVCRRAEGEEVESKGCRRSKYFNSLPLHLPWITAFNMPKFSPFLN